MINDKISNFISDNKIRILIKEYIEKYNELFEKSTFLKRGIFNYSNATDIGKKLQDNGYFKTNYKLVIGDDEERKTITSQKELNELITLEKQKILNDNELVSRFEKIDKQIKNKELKIFKQILESNPELIAELDNYNEFKKKIWTSYFKFNKEISESNEFLIHSYEATKAKLKNILKKARQSETEWNEVVNIFNNRFDVLFEVSIENQADVILNEVRPTLVFKYKNNDDESSVSKEQLMSVLSRGEQRALYILNIIFEIEGIKKEGKEILVVFDDIADSFYYKNKMNLLLYNI